MKHRSEVRVAYEKKQQRKGVVIAALSSLTVVAALLFFVPRAPGWQKVQNSFFNGDILFSTFPSLLKAFTLDIAIFLWSLPAIAILGLLLALARDQKSPAMFPLRAFSIAFTDIFRGVPVILTVFLIGFGIPGLGLPRPWNSPYIWGSLALILTYSAYVAEIIR
ncbi:MAG: ABC transporter permease subunit, partial [Gammaproteobacteria bacterium]|nr:ABC transporter permease subunit [Gammaproteobacteria bacterium]